MRSGLVASALFIAAVLVIAFGIMPGSTLDVAASSGL
jgi:hypothetical protein